MGGRTGDSNLSVHEELLERFVIDLKSNLQFNLLDLTLTPPHCIFYRVRSGEGSSIILEESRTFDLPLPEALPAGNGLQTRSITIETINGAECTRADDSLLSIVVINSHTENIRDGLDLGSKRERQDAVRHCQQFSHEKGCFAR